MKHSRKKRTPQLNLDKLKEVGSQIRAEGDLGALASYFLLLERMEQEGVLTAPFIALEALARITTARTEGYQEGGRHDIRSVFLYDRPLTARDEDTHCRAMMVAIG